MFKVGDKILIKKKYEKQYNRIYKINRDKTILITSVNNKDCLSNCAECDGLEYTFDGYFGRFCVVNVRFELHIRKLREYKLKRILT